MRTNASRPQSPPPSPARAGFAGGSAAGEAPAAPPPTLHVVLPSQQIARRGSDRILPQRRLMAAVLRTVLDDWRGAGGADADLHRYEEARAYVESTDRTWPFSFDNICEALGLDAQRVRRELPAGTPIVR